MALAESLEESRDARHDRREHRRSLPVSRGKYVLASHGYPWHHEPRDAIQGDHLMSIDELLNVCRLLLPVSNPSYGPSSVKAFLYQQVSTHQTCVSRITVA